MKHFYSSDPLSGQHKDGTMSGRDTGEDPFTGFQNRYHFETQVTMRSESIAGPSCVYFYNDLGCV